MSETIRLAQLCSHQEGHSTSRRSLARVNVRRKAVGTGLETGTRTLVIQDTRLKLCQLSDQRFKGFSRVHCLEGQFTQLGRRKLAYLGIYML